MANTFYNRTIRKMVIGFGNLFNNITLVRYNRDNTESERVIVPIVYADKENYVRRLSDDPDLAKKVQVTLPIMSFEMTGFQYDSSRKLNTNIKNFSGSVTSPTRVVSQYNPIPYNFDFNLYLYVRNIEDGTQIVEHVLSYFTPDYTIKLNMIPEMGIVKEVPIILNSASQEVDFEGDRERETRIIIWTFNFTVKGFIFGPVSNVGNIIETSITHIMSSITADDVMVFNMISPGTGSYQLGETVYQGYSFGTAAATATVLGWNNNHLKLTNIRGNFVTNQPIIGSTTNASYKFSAYNLASSSIPEEQVTITVTPNPESANVNSLWTANTVIIENI